VLGTLLWIPQINIEPIFFVDIRWVFARDCLKLGKFLRINNVDLSAGSQEDAG